MAYFANTYKSNYVSNEDIYLILKQEILNLVLKPGQLISENDISKRFNVSRTPIRSAFEKLKSDSLIEVVPKKGTYVSLLDMDLIEQIIFMRCKVEIDIMKSIAKEPDKILIQKLKANLIKQQQQVEKGVDASEFYRLDCAFHRLCFQYVGKDKLWQIIQNLQVHYTRYRMLDFVVVKKFDILYSEHAQLLELMVNAKLDEIEQVSETHLYGSISRLGDRLISEFKDYFIKSEGSVGGKGLLSGVDWSVRKH